MCINIIPAMETVNGSQACLEALGLLGERPTDTQKTTIIPLNTFTNK